jgi:predicted transcriptional regulator
LLRGAKVFLLYIRSGVHLVLKEKSYFDLPWKRRLTGISRPYWRELTNMDPYTKMDPLEEYVRIGILRIPEDESVRYIRNLLAKQYQICIVPYDNERWI